MGHETERAVVVTFNWITEDIMRTAFDGPDAATRANEFMQTKIASSDFPPPDWVWFMHANDAAREQAAAAFIDKMMGNGER